jgi:hypothetical protein
MKNLSAALTILFFTVSGCYHTSEINSNDSESTKDDPDTNEEHNTDTNNEGGDSINPANLDGMWKMDVKITENNCPDISAVADPEKNIPEYLLIKTNGNGITTYGCTKETEDSCDMTNPQKGTLDGDTITTSDKNTLPLNLPNLDCNIKIETDISINFTSEKTFTGSIKNKNTITGTGALACSALAGMSSCNIKMKTTGKKL